MEAIVQGSKGSNRSIIIRVFSCGHDFYESVFYPI
jgi:hypothetical protein